MCDWLYGKTTWIPCCRLISPVSDRPGHDRRYAIDSTRISTELDWQPRHSFEAGLVPAVADAGGGRGELIPAKAPIVD